jgi:hypothetical protein
MFHKKDFVDHQRQSVTSAVSQVPRHRPSRSASSGPVSRLSAGTRARNFSSDKATFLLFQANQFYLVHLSGKIMAAHSRREGAAHPDPRGPSLPRHGRAPRRNRAHLFERNNAGICHPLPARVCSAWRRLARLIPRQISSRPRWVLDVMRWVPRPTSSSWPTNSALSRPCLKSDCSQAAPGEGHGHCPPSTKKDMAAVPKKDFVDDQRISVTFDASRVSGRQTRLPPAPRTNPTSRRRRPTPSKTEDSVSCPGSP